MSPSSTPEQNGHTPLVQDRYKRPVRDLRISVTDRCNLRCTYCMPKEIFDEHHSYLPKDKVLRLEEIVQVAQAAAELGVNKIRITGGEPLLRKSLPHLIEMLHVIPGIEDLALTTNAILLPRHAKDLAQAGLNRITVSLDSLDDATAGKINGMDVGVAPVLEGIQAAIDAGLGPVKINTVLQRGVNDHEILSLAEHFRGTGHILRFIEFMDVGTMNRWNMDAVVSSREIHDTINAVHPLEAASPNYAGEVARRYRYVDSQGEIGLISSVTQPFCGDCTRLRLSSEGKLYTCLFGTQGHDLLGPIRAGMNHANLVEQIRGVWQQRGDRYSEERNTDKTAPQKVEMYHIGG